MNLVVNACDAMPDGGSLVVETSNRHLGQHQSAATEGMQAGDYVVLTVSDTGLGIAPDVPVRRLDSIGCFKYMLYIVNGFYCILWFVTL